MMIPRWLIFLIAFWVLSWGCYRIYLGFKANRAEEGPERPVPKKGLFGRSARSHIVYGAVYLLLGGYLVSMGFGHYFTLSGGCGPRQAGEQQSTPAE